MGNINKDDGFKTPEGYFEGLSDRILGKLENKSAELPPNSGFKVPEGYFDSLNEKILAKLEEKETKVVKLYPFKRFLYTAASVAAVILIVIGLQWQGDQDVTFEDIANMELESYFESYVSSVNTYELAEVLQVEELEINDILETELDEENIVEYLDNTIDDIDELNLMDDE